MPITFAKLGQYGRMGNSLFQAATTIAHAIRNNGDYIFPHWEYENDFNIPNEKFVDLKNIAFSQTYDEPHFHYAGIPYAPNMNIHGYRQSYKYFQDQWGNIKSLLTPKYEAEPQGATSIHVRRTDYLIHTGCYNILDMNYYNQAMEIANTSKFLVFSDDIEWCKEHFVGNNFEFVEGNAAPVDMAIMSKCTNNIAANSSFSWWGSWLNDNPNKKVIAPATWFGPKLAPTHDTKDLLPPDWIKVPGGSYA